MTYFIPHPGVTISAAVGYLLAGADGIAIGLIAWSTLNIVARTYKECK